MANPKVVTDWRMEPWRARGVRVYNRAGMLIATVEQPPSMKRREAIAQLIAKAPTVLRENVEMRREVVMFRKSLENYLEHLKLNARHEACTFEIILNQFKDRLDPISERIVGGGS